MTITRRAFILFSSTLLSYLEDLIGWKLASSQSPTAAWGNERNSKFENASARLVDSALPSDPPERVFKVPGKDFAPSVKQFVDEFRVYWSHHQDFPIKRAFEILPINVVRDSGVDQLIGRGKLHFEGDKVSNSGDEVEIEFGDQTLGHINIPFPENISAQLKPVTSGYELIFAEPATVLFKNLDPKWKVGQNQRLTRIAFSPSIVSYFFFQKTNGAKIRLDVDLALSQPPNNSALSERPLLASLMLPVTLRMTAPQDHGDGHFFFACCCNPHLTGNGPVLLKAQCIYVNGAQYQAFYIGQYFTQIDGSPDTSYINKMIHLEAYPFVKCDQYVEANGRQFVLAADFIVDSILNQTNLVTWPNQSVTVVSGHATS